MYKIRFNLGRGCNYKKWKVENTETGEVQYVDPDKNSLFIENCKLRNQRGTAEKIHGGANKTVCAWVEARDVEVYEIVDLNQLSLAGELFYNPRVLPYWHDVQGKCVDGNLYQQLVTLGKRVFVDIK